MRKGRPGNFDAAHTLTWSDQAHFLVVTIDGTTMRIEPFGELVDDVCRPLARFDRAGVQVDAPITLSR